MQKRYSLWQEISVVLLVKMALIFAIWWLFFSNPVDKNLQPSDIGSHLFKSNLAVNSYDAS